MKQEVSASYIIPGSPIALARARFSNQRVWDSQKQLKINIGLVLRHQHAERPLFMGPLHIDLAFYMPIPQSLSQKKKLAMDGTPHYCKPDVDNLIKLALDCCNGIVYKDDCQVAVICAKKIYSTEPRTIVTVQCILD